MLKKKLLAALAGFTALAALPAVAYAQAAPQAAPAPAAKDADPAIWVVKDADTTIYLFGTVHVLKPGLSWFDEAVKAAFDKSDTVVLEMIEPDTATMQGLIMKTAVAPATDPTLTDKLPADKRAPYAAALADVGIPAAALDRLEPWFAAMTLSIAPLQKLGYDPNSGAERTITEAAKAANKEVIGLETAEQQLGYFDGLPADLQIKFLVNTIDEYKNAGPTLDKMVVQWAAGDPDALGATLNEEMRKTPELAKIVLSERNARWADWISARLAKPGTVFVAVGAGHLAGSDSVQAYLAKRNLKAERIQY
ncbi:TraB/GumN family protein [Sphingomonas sp. HITSZ_GF]|uniref:TraB/GumN family protein n=1 Tax=Sphingomonas sp. HITSZ_GF TaxID=3037247 RepID=UPI00240E67B7|nr:TraB/GumN family protein [Sphingomonas sp. HITSZ_GF]MDG2535650.1 TraB/GumN family protein [Sphingomonas sp. HITSZ_GF]